VSDRRTAWAMPDWMRPYAEFIRNTGGNDIEALVNGTTDVWVNAPLALLEVAVHSQVALLQSLHAAGLLHPRLGVEEGGK
jgi:hypothetical protein